VAAYPAGAVADGVGRRIVLSAGVVLFAAACAAFALGPTSIAVLAALFVAIGTSTALVETGEGAHAAEVLRPSVRGRGFGLLGLVDGVGDLVASVSVGIPFTVASPAASLLYATATSAVGGAILLVPSQRGEPRGPAVR